jgi:toxin YoeB
MRKRTIFELSAFEDLKEWQIIDNKTYRKIIAMIKNIKNYSSKAIAISEPLEGKLKGYWSIKIDEQHRLVYKITSTEIIIIACRYHYN